MKQQPTDGLAAAETLYKFDDKSKVSSPPEKCNLHKRPSLIPGVKYPTTDREERLMDAAYAKGYKDADRLHQASKTEDPMLSAMRELITQIRKEKGLE